MPEAPPRWTVPRVAALLPPDADRAAWESAWALVPPLPPLALSDGSGAAEQATTVRVAWDERALHVRFDCEDRDAWGTYRERDDPLYEEEVVEVFLAPGDADPTRYVELEVSPTGVLFDARIHNPTGRRADLEADRAWSCPGLAWAAGALGPRQDWWAALAIPWSALLDPPAAPPRRWRANFYRIERPRGGAVEHSAWAPTWARPADFHRPACFGHLTLGGSSGSS
ncbi:MAG TPA: carbohydrate-binding family 9-like protein [Thermoanaerobaculia bacterium]